MRPGIPQNVLDIYEAARNASTVEAAVAELDKARFLSKRDRAIFACNLQAFNQAAKKNDIIFVEVLDRKDMSLRVLYREPPKPSA